MLHDVDASLMALVRRDVLVGSDVEVVLDAPTKEWAARRNAPVVNLYLYDIRESLAHRQETKVEQRDDHGQVVERRLPVRLFRLSYLVTAWTQRPEDEHRLLAAVMSGLLAHDTLPADVLAGSLTGCPVAIPFTLARPVSQERSISDVWSALGGELKPSLDVVVTVPMQPGGVELPGPPVKEARVTLSDRTAPARVEGRGRPRRPRPPARPADRPADRPARKKVPR